MFLRLNFLNIHTGYVNLKAGPFAGHSVFLPLSVATAVMAASLKSAPHESACRSVCMWIICTYLYLDLGLVCVPAGFSSPYTYKSNIKSRRVFRKKNTANKVFWVITTGKMILLSWMDGYLSVMLRLVLEFWHLFSSIFFCFFLTLQPEHTIQLSRSTLHLSSRHQSWSAPRSNSNKPRLLSNHRRSHKAH